MAQRGLLATNQNTNNTLPQSFLNEYKAKIENKVDKQLADIICHCYPSRTILLQAKCSWMPGRRQHRTTQNNQGDRVDSLWTSEYAQPLNLYHWQHPCERQPIPMPYFLHSKSIPRNPLNFCEIPFLITKRTDAPCPQPPLNAIQMKHMPTIPKGDT